MSRKVRHVYADDDEYIAVHRTPSSYGGGSYNSSSSVGENIGCLIMIALCLLVIWGKIVVIFLLIALGIKLIYKYREPLGKAAHYTAEQLWIFIKWSSPKVLKALKWSVKMFWVFVTWAAPKILKTLKWLIVKTYDFAKFIITKLTQHFS